MLLLLMMMMFLLLLLLLCSFHSLLFSCSKLDEDTQLALALSVSATDSCDTNQVTAAQPATTSPVRDIHSILLSSARSPVRPKHKKKARYALDMLCFIYVIFG